MSKMQTRQETWKIVKSIGNYGGLKWQSKTEQWIEFIENHYEQKRLWEEEKLANTETLAVIYKQKTDTQEGVANLIDEIREKIDQLPAGKIIRLSNGKEFVTGKVANNKLTNRMYQEIDYTGEVTMTYTLIDDQVDEINHEQAYRIGDLNCLLQPILNIIQSKIDSSNSKNTERSYKSMLKNASMLAEQIQIHGATKQLVQSLANATCSTIKIYDVITQSHLKYKQTKQTKSQFKFKFMNTKFNHVDIWDGESQGETLHPNHADGKIHQEITREMWSTDLNTGVRTNLISDDMIMEQIVNYGNYENHSHMDEIMNKLYNEQKIFKYKKFNNCVVQIQSGLKNVMCGEYADLLNREQAINTLFDPLSIYLRTVRYNTKTQKNEESYEYSLIAMAQNQSGRVALKKRTTNPLKHIDMIAGYTQFQSLPEQYNYGFPFMTDLRKVTSVEFAVKHNGLYYVRLYKLPSHISAIFQENKPYSLCSAIIKYLRNNNVQIEISGGMYGGGQTSTHIQLPIDCKISSYGKKPYYTAVSKWACGDGLLKQDFYTPDVEMAQIARSLDSNNTIIDKGDGHYSKIIKKETKLRYKTKAHLYAFILQYQQLNMMIQLEKMDMNSVHLICGDDIYYEDHQFEMLPIFRNKGKNNYDAIYDMTEQEGNQFIINTDCSRYCEFGEEEPIYHQYQLHLGQGGSGKTYARHMDKGSINQVYLTLTNALVRDQKASPFQPRCYTKDKFLANMKQHKLCPSNFIIDECGLVGDGIRGFIAKNYPQARIYVLGDKYQISGEFKEGENPFDENKYDLILGEENFKTDYRAINCPRLQKIKLQIRQMVDLGYTEQQQFFELHKILNVITKEEWIQQYDVKQIITTCTNYAKNTWTSTLQGQKYRVQKTFTQNGHTYCTGDILTELPQGYYDFEKDQKNKTPKIVRQHAFTCHSLQGMTQNDKLLITCPSSHDIFKGYVYTAVSRLTKIEDLYALRINYDQQNDQE